LHATEHAQVALCKPSPERARCVAREANLSLSTMKKHTERCAFSFDNKKLEVDSENLFLIKTAHQNYPHFYSYLQQTSESPP
jgi:hypothetical protein